MLHFLVTLKISFCAKLFSALITLYVFMASFVHIKLPLVFEDVGFFGAFATDTNELSIPTTCVLCLLVIHQISLDYRTKVTIITTVNLFFLTITRSVQCFVPYQTLLYLRCLATGIAYPSLSCIFIVHSLLVAFRLVKLNILLHSPHWTFTIFFSLLNH